MLNREHLNYLFTNCLCLKISSLTDGEICMKLYDVLSYICEARCHLHVWFHSKR